MSLPIAIPEDDEMHLLPLLNVVMRHKKLVMLTTLGVTLAAIAVALLLPPVYSAKATIMPPQQQSSSVSGLLGQLGGLAGAAGSIAGLKNPNDVYVGMLQSRTVADLLIAQYKLKDRYDADTMEDTRKTFEKKRRVFSGKDGMISIEVDDRDPATAAAMANAHVQELAKLTQTFAITEASQRRLFFEKQLKLNKIDLANAEVALRHTQESTKTLQLGGQVQAIMMSTAQLRGTIAAKEVQLASMRTFATGQNPELLKVTEEINALRGQLARMEGGEPGKDGAIPIGKMPEVGVEYVRRLRDVKYYETIFELIAKQYELAKIDEAKDASTIQQLDVAIAPDKESTSRRKLIPVGGAIAGLLLGLFAAFAREFLARALPSGRLAQLRESAAAPGK